jgi:hypothetical protein
MGTDGLTAEEVEFIVHYDVKYRMGREADGSTTE